MSFAVIDSAGVTQTGNVRCQNEDAYLIRDPLFMVADGIGGAAAGEIASQIAADEFMQLDLRVRRGEDTLRGVITRANGRIHERARSDLWGAGMGTTVTAALMAEDGRIAFANVGDSRVYLQRQGELRLLSDDHSLVAELVRKGELSEQEAEHHPQRSVITRAVGAAPEVQVDTFTLEACAGDVVLLCTDGLNTMADTATISRLMASATDAASIAGALVQAALAGGGKDNVTVVVFRVGERAANDQDEQAS